MLLQSYLGGADNTAHEVVKVYMGVDNKARLIYEPTLTYTKPICSAVPPLTSARHFIGAAVSDKYIIFAGGMINSVQSREENYIQDVCAYNKNFTKTTATLATRLQGMSGVGIGDYCIFAGGRGYNSYYTKGFVTFNSSLVRGGSGLGTTADYIGDGQATYLPSYAVYAITDIYTQVGYAFNSSLVKTEFSVSALPRRPNITGTATARDIAFFAGDGSIGQYASSNKVATLTDDLVASASSCTLSEGRNSMCALSFGDYALFAGGFGTLTTERFRTVDAIDYNQVSRKISDLNGVATGTGVLVGAVSGNIAIFLNGSQRSITAYDQNLVRRTEAEGLYPISATNISSGSFNDAAWFAGGALSDGETNAVYTYISNSFYS